MEPQITVLILSGGVVVLAGIAAVTWLLDRLGRTTAHPRLGRDMERAWREVAGTLEDAAVQQPGSARPATLAGRLGGFAVTVRHLPSEPMVRLDIDGSGRIPSDLRIRAREPVPALGPATGDGDFDSRVWVEGDEVIVAALFDAATRSLVVDLSAHHGLSLEYGHLALVSSRTADANRLRREIESGVALARRLVEPSDVPARLATIAVSDPVLAARLRALRLLVDRWPDSAPAKAACEAAIRDPDDETRLVAAVAHGPAGEAALADIACSPDTSEERARRALEVLGPRLPAARTVALVDDALRRGRRALATQAIATLGKTAGPLAVARLVALARGPDFDASIKSVRALEAAADPSAEGALVDLLESGSGVMRAAAVAALGRLGTAAAVAPLRHVADAHPLDLGLHRTVASAIGLIQERLTGAAPGQLSLAQGATGQLSLLPDALRGSLSPVDPSDPRSR